MGHLSPVERTSGKGRSAVVLKSSLSYRGSSRVGDRVQERRPSPFAPEHSREMRPEEMWDHEVISWGFWLGGPVPVAEGATGHAHCAH